MKNRFRLTYKELIGQLYVFYRDISAGKRGHVFDLSVEEFENLVVGKNCTYCKKPPKRKKTTQDKGSITYTGIDRVNNYLGYTVSNCVPCCTQCNKLKSNLSFDTLKAYSSIYETLNMGSKT